MLRLSRAIYDEMVSHVLSDYPKYEACGLLAGRGEQVSRLYRARNKELSPVRYYVEDTDLLRIFRDIDAAQLELIGIYHSHLRSEARPSATDIRLATYPEATYVIISLADPRAPAVRGFRIHDGTYTEEPIEVTP